MNKKFLSSTLCTVLFALCVPAEAQQATKVPRIGFLSATSPSAITARVEAFRQGLRELGYAEGKDIIVEWRYAEGKLDRQRELAAELVRLKVEAIVSAGPEPTRAAKAATSVIPIVMTNDPDPVGDGFIANLARPGGNITGLSTFAPELSGKRLEILREVVPKLSNVAILGTSTAPGQAQMIRESELALNAFRVKLQYLDVLDSKDIEPAFRAASNGRANGLLTLPSGILILQRSKIVELAAKNRLPAVYHSNQFIKCFMARTASTWIGAQPVTWPKFLKAPSPPIFPWSSPRSLTYCQSQGGQADRINHSAQCFG